MIVQTSTIPKNISLKNLMMLKGLPTVAKKVLSEEVINLLYFKVGIKNVWK